MNKIPEIVGVSRNIEYVKELIQQIACAELNTLVCGETGVGKDLVVQHLYQKSNRCGKPIIKVNCAAIPDNLLESEMFGYEKGAFTGAEKNKRGKFEQAHGGVLFLDEIGEMSPALQAKLLRVIQDGEFSPLSSEKIIKTVWIIAATNCNIEKHIKAGKFRKDLYYRLSTMMIQIDPLRKRPEDIPLLINYYCKKYAANFKDMPLKIITKELIEKLTKCDWSGNIRELQNVLQRIQILNTDDKNIDEIISNTNNKTPIENPSNFHRVPIPDGTTENQNFPLPLKKIKKKVFAKIEKEMIIYALNKSNFNITKASEMLDISLRSLHMKIKEFGLNMKPTVKNKDSNLRYLYKVIESNEEFLDGYESDHNLDCIAESIKTG